MICAVPCDVIEEDRIRPHKFAQVRGIDPDVLALSAAIICNYTLTPVDAA